MQQTPLFEEEERCLNVVRFNEQRDLLSLFVPSHDKSQKAITDQSGWANQTCRLFCELYGGATAFTAVVGMYSDEGTILRDKPVVVQSLALRDDVEDLAKLRKLMAFIHEMGRELKQAAMALTMNQQLIFIDKYKSRKQLEKIREAVES